jgi:L-threonylcarbamoyladenylate synthase
MANATAQEIAAGAARLRAGGVVAFPTETVYGLGADALDGAAVARVFALKGRPSHNPLIVHVSGPAMAARVVAPGAWDARAAALGAAFWPGPLSIVLARGAAVPEIVTGGGPTVAVRCPDHPVARALLEAFGGPLVGPSANRSGAVSPTEAGHVRGAFDERDVLVLDGGACRTGIESTVVRLLDGRAEILRPGVIGPEAIERVIGVPTAYRAGRAEVADAPGAALASPGLLTSHYAPATPSRMMDLGAIEDLLRGGAEGTTGAAAKAGRVVVAYSPVRVERPDVLVALPRDAEGYAAGLYAALRRADALGMEEMVIERPRGEGAVWRAVLDRLERATAGRGGA